ncbi:MAG: peptidoglycan-binding protein [Peptococcia bacterium]
MQYVVQPGDTLFSIAQRFGTTVQAIIQANNIINPDFIVVGQIITIPTGQMPPVPTPPAPNPPAPQPTQCPTLRRGNSGPFVRVLQTQLQRAGVYNGPIDGIFGPRTEAAVRAFQRQRNLPVTGVVDVATWTALGVTCTVAPPTPTPPPAPPEQFFCPTLRLGDVGPAVRFLQRQLQQRGFYQGVVDGDFGGRTERAVREFQRSQNLRVTGVVDHATWRALGVDCNREPTPPQGTPIATRVGRGLRHILFTDRRVYNRRDTVRISLSKTNITTEEVTLRYRTNQIIEITITNAAGNVVWRLSNNRQFAQAQRVITIFPGGTQVINENWNLVNNAGRPVPPGTYTVTVENLATNVRLSVQVEVR